MKPKISVVIPLYNKERYIEAALHSVLAQNFPDFEVILVDDASTDESYHRAASFKNEKIKLYKNEQNKGLSATRNTAISKAKGEIIALLDADDLWKPEHLKNIFLLSKKYSEAKVYGTNYLEKVSDQLVPVKKNVSEEQETVLLDDFFSALLHQPPFCPSSLAFKKEVFDNVGGFNENVQVGEDTDFLIKAGLQFKIAYHNFPSCIYTLFSENQITTGKLGNKNIPDFSEFQKQFPQEGQLIKYMDFQRYTYALKYKAEGNTDKFKAITSEIDMKNLNRNQRLLLKLPRPVYNTLKRLKVFLLKKSIRWTSF